MQLRVVGGQALVGLQLIAQGSQLLHVLLGALVVMELLLTLERLIAGNAVKGLSLLLNILQLLPILLVLAAVRVMPRLAGGDPLRLLGAQGSGDAGLALSPPPLLLLRLARSPPRSLLGLELGDALILYGGVSGWGEIQSDPADPPGTSDLSDHVAAG